MTSQPLCSEGPDEPLAGTAPSAQAWLALEAPGPWTAKPFTSSLISDAVTDLVGALEALGVRTVLIRRPGQQRRSNQGHQVFFADVATGRLCGAQAERLDEVTAWWSTGSAYPRRSAPLTAIEHPVALVCTNGSRDKCCALRGRGLAAQTASTHPDRVWEATHLSGHRFAPTALLLPQGLLYGRLDAVTLEGLLAGKTAPSHARGRSSLSPAAQAAEIAVWRERPELAEFSLTAITAETFAVCDNAGRVRARVEVQRHEPGSHPGIARPESCGRDAVTWSYLEAHVHDVTDMPGDA